MSGEVSHWEKVYAGRAAHQLSWYQPRLDLSLEMIAEAKVPKDAGVIDIGGGDSTLVDDLLAAGYERITVLDISALALARAKARLGARGEAVTWIEADIANAALQPNAYDLWHDRATFHFLTDAGLRRRYVETCRRAVSPGGAVILATFAPDGPDSCSGLPTMRYGAEELERELGEGFRLMGTRREVHTTPLKRIQAFVYCRFERRETINSR